MAVRQQVLSCFSFFPVSPFFLLRFHPRAALQLCYTITSGPLQAPVNPPVVASPLPTASAPAERKSSMERQISVRSPRGSHVAAAASGALSLRPTTSHTTLVVGTDTAAADFGAVADFKALNAIKSISRVDVALVGCLVANVKVAANVKAATSVKVATAHIYAAAAAAANIKTANAHINAAVVRVNAAAAHLEEAITYINAVAVHITKATGGNRLVSRRWEAADGMKAVPSRMAAAVAKLTSENSYIVLAANCINAANMTDTVSHGSSAIAQNEKAMKSAADAIRRAEYAAHLVGVKVDDHGNVCSLPRQATPPRQGGGVLAGIASALKAPISRLRPDSSNQTKPSATKPDPERISEEDKKSESSLQPAD